MLGIVWAAINEYQTGETILSQAQHISVQGWLTVVLCIYATLVPVMHSARMEAFGMFSPRAELTNGRAAMMGFLCMILLEYRTGVPFF